MDIIAKGVGPNGNAGVGGEVGGSHGHQPLGVHPAFQEEKNKELVLKSIKYIKSLNGIINFSTVSQVTYDIADPLKNEKGLILDPFCGSGTVLQEALLMGFTQVAGTDLSPKAITDTKENIAWIKEKYNLNAQKLVS